MFEREGQLNAVEVGDGRDAQQRHDAGVPEADALAAGGEADVGVRRDVPAPVRDRIRQAMDRQRPILIEPDHELELTAADGPLITRGVVRDERICERRHDRRRLGAHRCRRAHHERDHRDSE